MVLHVLLLMLLLQTIRRAWLGMLGPLVQLRLEWWDALPRAVQGQFDETQCSLR